MCLYSAAVALHLSFCHCKALRCSNLRRAERGEKEIRDAEKKRIGVRCNGLSLLVLYKKQQGRKRKNSSQIVHRQLFIAVNWLVERDWLWGLSLTEGDPT